MTPAWGRRLFSNPADTGPRIRIPGGFIKDGCLDFTPGDSDLIGLRCSLDAGTCKSALGDPVSSHGCEPSTKLPSDSKILSTHYRVSYTLCKFESRLPRTLRVTESKQFNKWFKHCSQTSEDSWIFFLRSGKCSDESAEPQSRR